MTQALERELRALAANMRACAKSWPGREGENAAAEVEYLASLLDEHAEELALKRRDPAATRRAFAAFMEEEHR